MAAVESYSPCPCGSGQKYKWCCQKVEPVVAKAQRLVQAGQPEAAIKALDEGLRKEPDSPLLLTRKAVLQMQTGQIAAAPASLRRVLVKDPKHFGALVLLTRCVLETEGPVYGAGMFQELLATVDAERRPALGGLAEIIATLFVEARRYPAALKHLELARALGDPDNSTAQGMRSVETSPGVAAWLKDAYFLESTPGYWTGEGRDRFEEGLALASHGLWARAAGAFDHVSGGEPGGEADHNLGICRLWLGDQEGAVDPLRRRVARLGTTPAAVDLEALCQLIAPLPATDRIEQVELSWPLRDRARLIEALRARPDVAHLEAAEDDPEAPTIAEFALLDRPRLPAGDGAGLAPADLPNILGRVVVTADAATLEAVDDGRLDGLGDRFAVLAGASIVPAHPRTKILGHESRARLAMSWDWLYPEGITPAEMVRLERTEQDRLLADVWPGTPLPALGLRTPEQAARDEALAVPLRAALCQLEWQQELIGSDPAPLRERLGVAPEPAPDAGTADAVARLPIARLGVLVIADLPDEALLVYYRRVRRYALTTRIEAAARVVVERRSLLDGGLIDPVVVFSDLASLAASRGDLAGIRDWIARGRANDAPAARGRNAPIWDMTEIRLRYRLEDPEVWVPELAVILERFGQDPNANQVLMMSLYEMGLVGIEPNPDDPERLLIDSRPLQALMARFGPKITTASGRLGVSATKPDLWTPGGAAPGAPGGGLWTPGSARPPAPAGAPAAAPKLILPGR